MLKYWYLTIWIFFINQKLKSILFSSLISLLPVLKWSTARDCADGCGRVRPQASALIRTWKRSIARSLPINAGACGRTTQKKYNKAFSYRLPIWQPSVVRPNDVQPSGRHYVFLLLDFLNSLKLCRWNSAEIVFVALLNKWLSYVSNKSALGHNLSLSNFRCFCKHDKKWRVVLCINKHINIINKFIRLYAI